MCLPPEKVGQCCKVGGLSKLGSSLTAIRSDGILSNEAPMKVCPVCKTVYEGGEVFCPVDAARLVTPSQIALDGPKSADALVGSTLDNRYAIKERIGEGGMGLVYRGVHTGIEKPVAIKVLRDDFSNRSEVVERFRQEAKSASRIGNEHIVDISDFGETPSGQCYFVMEFLEGEDLANVLAREGTIGMRRAVEIAIQCTEALGAAHSKGIVHRDMKPENVFVTKKHGKDFIKIVDFGIAKMSDVETEGAPGRKLTKTGMIFGTPEYMSPEQAAGKSLDHRVDVYAVGVILYEMLTGRVPFVGDTFMGILTQHMFEEPPTLREVNPSLSCSDEVEQVVYAAMSKDPEQRYPTMEVLREALSDALEGRVTAATLSGFRDVASSNQNVLHFEPEHTGGFETASASKWPMFLAALLCLGIGAGGVVWWKTSQTKPIAAVTSEKTPKETAPKKTVTQKTELAPPPQVAAAEKVDVEIQTEPQGARVIAVPLDGSAPQQDCQASPCTLSLPKGKTYRFSSVDRRGSGSVELLINGPQKLLIPRTTRVVVKGRGMRTGMQTKMTAETAPPTISEMTNDVAPPTEMKRPKMGCVETGGMKCPEPFKIKTDTLSEQDVFGN